MADKKIQIISPAGDKLLPETSGAQVIAADGTTTFENHLTEIVTYQANKIFLDIRGCRYNG